MNFPAERNGSPPWGIIASIGWVLVAMVASLAVAAAVYGVLRGADSGARMGSYDGVVITIGTVASVPIQVAVLVFAARLRGWSAMQYFALTAPRWAEILFAVIALVVVDAAFDVMLLVSGRDLVPPFQIEAYRSAQGAGWFAALWIAIVAVAPVGEEIMFRGFLYRGLARPGSETLAIAVIALGWAMLHIQYDWLGMAQVFAVGLMLGWFRWVSNSTVLSIVMHVLINLEAMLETTIKAEWLS